MRFFLTLAVAAATLTATVADARHYYNGRSHSQCRRDKRNAGHQGIAVGAVAGGAGGALLGATACGVAGSVVGRGTEHCADATHAH